LCARDFSNIYLKTLKKGDDLSPLKFYNIPKNIIIKHIIAKTNNTAQAIINSFNVELSPFGSW